MSSVSLARDLTPTVDPVTAEVVARHLLISSDEMAAALIRSSFSANVKERGDCSTAIFSADGELIAQSHRSPLHLGSMMGFVGELTRRFPLDTIKPGDMFAANDPYNGGGSHLPDINIGAPVFVEDRIVAFVMSCSHHADVGGMVPGSVSAACTTIYQEGIRIPPVQIMRRGVINRDVFDMILLNSRTPEERSGDIKAQFAANKVGIRGVTALFQRFGYERTMAAIAAYLDFTEERFVAAIRRLTPGTYEAEDYIGGSTAGTRSTIKVKLTVGVDRLSFDFRGSSPQLKKAINIPRQALVATLYTVAKSIFDPDIPANSGYLRTIEIISEPGSIVHPVEPAPTGVRSQSCIVLGDAIAQVLSLASSEEAVASWGPHQHVSVSGLDPRDGSYFVNLETIAGGMGAMPDRDGYDNVRGHGSGSMNLPIEVLEHAFPFRIEQYALRIGSGGNGKYRGGLGVIRDYRFLGESTAVSLSSVKPDSPADGMAGGEAGAPGGFTLNPGTPDERALGGMVAEMSIPFGSVLRVESSGGGGYGPAAARDPELLTRDARDSL